MNVVAGGTPPLSYQWYYKGEAIADATVSALVLPHVSVQQEGLYYVVVTNAAGSVTSSNALLTVNYPPALVKVSDVTASGAGRWSSRSRWWRMGMKMHSRLVWNLTLLFFRTSA
jgi:hypothetical protein